MGLPVAKVGSMNTARRQRMALGSKHALFLFVFLKTARMVQHLGREGSGDGNIQCRSEAEAEAKKRFYDGGTMRQSQFRTCLLMSTTGAIARGRYLCNFCSPAFSNGRRWNSPTSKTDNVSLSNTLTLFPF